MADYIDYHFGNCTDIAERVFGGIVPDPPRRRKNDRGRIGTENVEKTIRRKVRTAIRADGTGKGNRAWADRSKQVTVQKSGFHGTRDNGQEFAHVAKIRKLCPEE
jgi:hypothetical protein